MLSDIVKALELLPGWKAIAAAPERIAQLEARVAALETRVSGGGATAGACPKCGTGVLRFVSERPDPVFGVGGALIQTMRCDTAGCGHVRDRHIKP